MKTFAEQIETALCQTINECLDEGFNDTWQYGGHNVHARPQDQHVKVTDPNHPNYGKTGHILRQQGIEYGVEHDDEPGKLHWYNAGHITPHVKAQQHLFHHPSMTTPAKKMN